MFYKVLSVCFFMVLSACTTMSFLKVRRNEMFYKVLGVCLLMVLSACTTVNDLKDDVKSAPFAEAPVQLEAESKKIVSESTELSEINKQITMLQEKIRSYDQLDVDTRRALVMKEESKISGLEAERLLLELEIEEEPDVLVK